MVTRPLTALRQLVRADFLERVRRDFSQCRSKSRPINQGCEINVVHFEFRFVIRIVPCYQQISNLQICFCPVIKRAYVRRLILKRNC